jgi:signal transduction histidine kinase
MTPTRTHGRPVAPVSDLPDAGPSTLVFSARARTLGSGAIAILALILVGVSAAIPDDRDGYLLAHAVTAVPLMFGATVLAHRARRDGPSQFELFWRRWATACGAGGLAGVATIGAVALHAPVLLAVDVALLVAATPFWLSAMRHMLRAQAGQRDPSVDLIDAAMALVVLSAPFVLMVVEPVGRSPEPMFAVPFAVFVALIPAGLYLGLVNLTRVARDERVTQGLGIVLGAAFCLSVSLQLAHVVAELDLPLSVFVGVHVVNLSLVMALPLWAHRTTAGGLARLPVEHQARVSHPMPAISAVVLPLVALAVLLWHDEPWAVAYVAALMSVVVVLNAVRHALLTREARRLSGDLVRMAEERRQLLANMVRALDDDRRRSVSELHTQAVGSLSTLGTIVQTACVSLPSATAQLLKETISQLQGDLTDRAEELRRLMVAMRAPSFTDRGGNGHGSGDDVLTAALRAYASELLDTVPPADRPQVLVSVDPELELDRTAMTIAYRVAQEALHNATRHAHAGRVDVRVRVADGGGGVVVEVEDDGVGFDPDAEHDGAGLATMRLFSELGRGEVSVRSTPGRGTVVCSLLGGAPEGRVTPDHRSDQVAAVPAGAPAATVRRHLRLLPTVEVGPSSGPE